MIWNVWWTGITVREVEILLMVGGFDVD
jgi:hypothetical protein